MSVAHGDIPQFLVFCLFEWMDSVHEAERGPVGRPRQSGAFSDVADWRNEDQNWRRLHGEQRH